MRIVQKHAVVRSVGGYSIIIMPKSSFEDLFVSVRTKVKQAVIDQWVVIVQAKVFNEDLFVSLRVKVKQAVIRSVGVLQYATV